MTFDEDVARRQAERDQLFTTDITTLDNTACAAIQTYWHDNFGIDLPSDPTLLQITVHQLRSSRTQLPAAQRLASANWLLAAGYSHNATPDVMGGVVPVAHQPV